MKKQIEENLDGQLSISLTPDKHRIQVALDKEGCEFLIEELNLLLSDKKHVTDYEAGEGNICQLFAKKSLGLVMYRKDRDNLYT